MQYLSVFVLFISLFSSCKTEKIIDRSTRNQPGWVHGIAQDYIILAAVGKSHEEAKQNLTIQLKEYIIHSIAVQVNAQSDFSVNETLMDNIRVYQEKFSSSTQLNSQVITALRGININKSEAFYWETKRNKDKSTQIHYHIKYPFSRSEHQKLIKDWEKLDQELNEEITVLENALTTCTNFSHLLELNLRSKSLIHILNEPRKTRAVILHQKTQQLINASKLIVVNHIPGQLILALTAHQYQFNNNIPVHVSSNCLNVIRLFPSELDPYIVIEYDADYCMDQGVDNFELIWQKGTEKVHQKIPILFDANKARMSITKPIRFISAKGNATAENLWQIPLRLFNDVPIFIEEVEILVERTQNKGVNLISFKPFSYYTKEGIQENFNSKKEINLQINADKRRSNVDALLQVLNLSPNELYKASGKIYYSNLNDDKQYVYSFENIPVSIP